MAYEIDMRQKQTGVTSGKTQKEQAMAPLANTILAGARIPVAKVAKAAEVFIKAENGISAHSLGEQAGIATLTARRLIKKFHRAMAPKQSDRLDGLIHVVEFQISLHPAKGKSVQVNVTAACERNSNQLANRIAFCILADNDACPWRAYMDLINEKAIVQMQPRGDIAPALGYYGYAVETCACECDDVRSLAMTVLGKTYRYAMSDYELQGYLDEIAFRWNGRNHIAKTVEILMQRLISPPYAQKPRPKNDEYLEHLEALP